MVMFFVHIYFVYAVAEFFFLIVFLNNFVKNEIIN